MDFEFFLSGSFVWTYCAVIGVLWLYWTSKLVLKTRTLLAKLRDLNNDLESIEIEGEDGFARAFEAYNTKVNQVFGLPWAEFVETLVLPASDTDHPIRNTVEVSRYLNDATIIFPRISFSFFQAVPNLLTGLGILGTFIGLAFGVGAASSGLSSGSPAEITESLQQLLDGASLAFLTSICGILSSILFVPVVRISSRKLHLAVNLWVGTIEARLRRVTREGVALEQLEQAKRATNQLETFNTKLVFSIEKALEEGIANRLSPQIDLLVKAVQGLRSDRSTDAGQMIEQALDRFTAAMQGQTGSQFKEMASIVEKLNKSLEASTEGLAQSQTDVRETLSYVMQKVQTSMGEGATAMTKTLEESLGGVKNTISDASEKLAAQLTKSSAAAADRLTDVFSSATEKIAETGTTAVSQISESLGGLREASHSLERSTRQSKKVLEDMTTFVVQINSLRNTIESAHREIAGIAEPVGQAARDIRASSQNTVDAAKRIGTLVDTVDSLVRELEKHQQSVVSAWAKYQDRFEDIDESLAQVFVQIDEGLARYCEKVKDFANQLDKTTAQTVTNLAAATGELNQSIEDLTEHLMEEK